LGLSQLLRPVSQMAACLLPVGGILSATAATGTWHEGATIANMTLASLGLVAAALAYLGAAHWVGLAEVRRVTQRLARRLGRG